MLDESRKDVVQRLRDVPTGVMSFHFGQIADVTNMVSCAIWVCTPNHLLARHLFGESERLKDRTTVAAITAEVLNLAAANGVQHGRRSPQESGRPRVCAQEEVMDPTSIRDGAAALMRRVPRLRGHGRVSIAINSLFLSAGVKPIIVAPMYLGHRLILDGRVDSHVWAAYSGRYDDQHIKTLTRLLPKGGVALDVGANIGFYSVPLAKAAKLNGGRVVAFEPFPGNVERLRDNIELNGLTSIADIRAVGLSDTNGSAMLELRDDFIHGDTGNAVIVRGDQAQSQWQRVAVPLVTLDELWPRLRLDRLDVVKADIEGHEVQFMKGASKTLSTFRPVIQLEVNRGHYEPRGIDIGSAFKGAVPDNYRFASLGNAGNLALLEDITAHAGEDIYAIPAEQAGEICRAK